MVLSCIWPPGPCLGETNRRQWPAVRLDLDGGCPGTIRGTAEGTDEPSPNENLTKLLDWTCRGFTARRSGGVIEAGLLLHPAARAFGVVGVVQRKTYLFDGARISFHPARDLPEARWRSSQTGPAQKTHSVTIAGS